MGLGCMGSDTVTSECSLRKRWFAQMQIANPGRAPGAKKNGGVHVLCHAYAARQLETGLAAQCVQRLLGHQDLRATLGGVQRLPSCRDGEGELDLLAKLKVPRIPIALCEWACHDLRCRCGRGAILLDYRQSQIGSMLI